MQLARSLPLLLACTCRHPAPTSATAAPIVLPEPSAEAPIDPNEIVALPMELADPPWLEPAIADEPSCPTCASETLAIGESAALVRIANSQVFANVIGRGVIGPLFLPADRVWIGMGSGNRPFIADPFGQLWSADDLESASDPNSWQRRGRVTGATRWDLSASRIVATDGERVFVSSDAGATFVSGPRLGRVKHVFVRHDGVLTALLVGRGDAHEIRLSKDDGRTWKRSKLRAAKLVRNGAWITNDESGRCAAVLASDGLTWVHPSEAEQHAQWNTMGWAGALQTTDVVDAIVHPNDHETFVHPAAPGVAGHDVISGARACPPAKSDGGEGIGSGVMGGVMGGMFMSDSAATRGVGRLRRSAAPKIAASDSDAAFFRDAVCAAAHGDEYGFCKPDTVLTRPPHIARIGRSSGGVRVEPLPKGCEQPQLAFGVRGLGVVVCRDGDGTRMFTAERDGPWRDEGRIEVRAGDVWNRSAGSDGTLLLQLRCAEQESCRVLVRAPLAAGEAAAWRVVAVPDAITYRAGPVGSVVAIVQPDPGQSDRMQIVLARPGAEPELLADARVQAEPYDVQVLADGRLRFAAQVDGKSENEVAFFVQRSGAVVATEPTPERRTADGVIIMDARPLDPALVPER